MDESVDVEEIEFFFESGRGKLNSGTLLQQPWGIIEKKKKSVSVYRLVELLFCQERLSLVRKLD